jgi:hypothetical protein
MSALASVATGSALDKNAPTATPSSTTSQTVSPANSSDKVITSNPVTVPEKGRSQSMTPPVEKSPQRTNVLRLSTEMGSPPLEVSDQFSPGNSLFYKLTIPKLIALQFANLASLKNGNSIFLIWMKYFKTHLCLKRKSKQLKKILMIFLLN